MEKFAKQALIGFGAGIAILIGIVFLVRWLSGY